MSRQSQRVTPPLRAVSPTPPSPTPLPTHAAVHPAVATTVSRVSSLSTYGAIQVEADDEESSEDDRRIIARLLPRICSELVRAIDRVHTPTTATATDTDTDTDIAVRALIDKLSAHILSSRSSVGATDAPSASSPSAPAAARLPPAVVVEDVSLHAGTVVPANARLLKVWKLTNVGTRRWPEQLTLLPVSSAATPIRLDTDVVLFTDIAPTESMNVSVAMTTPSTAGHYCCEYDFAYADEDTGESKRFNTKLVIDVNVKAGAGPPPNVPITIQPLAEQETDESTVRRRLARAQRIAEKTQRQMTAPTPTLLKALSATANGNIGKVTADSAPADTTAVTQTTATETVTPPPTATPTLAPSSISAPLPSAEESGAVSSGDLWSLLERTNESELFDTTLQAPADDVRQVTGEVSAADDDDEEEHELEWLQRAKHANVQTIHRAQTAANTAAPSPADTSRPIVSTGATLPPRSLTPSVSTLRPSAVTPAVGGVAIAALKSPLSARMASAAGNKPKRATIDWPSTVDWMK